MDKLLFLERRNADNMNVVSLLVGKTIEEVERNLIIETMLTCAGNKRLAAEILDINIKTLRNKLNKYKAEGHINEQSFSK